MKNWERVLLGPTTSVLEVIKVIDEGALQIAIVVDDGRHLLGTITDGDVRRALLKGIPLRANAAAIMNSKPTTARSTDSVESILAVMKLKRLHHIPVIDDENKVINIETLESILQPSHRDNWVIIMAGGLGTRLRPLTEDVPKPLLKVGSKPLLETIIGNFIEHGFRHFFLSVNYKADMIIEHFGDGTQWGIDIRYIHEDQRLGTAGALGLMEEKPSQPILVMNGDLLTKVNFNQLLEFHAEQRAQATMCVREYTYQIPYGVVHVDNNRLLDIQEKPHQSAFVNAGIYVLDPEALDLIPRNQSYDMPDLFARLISLNCETAVFPIREYWLDIGRRDDFERANGDYEEVFG